MPPVLNPRLASSVCRVRDGITLGANPQHRVAHWWLESYPNQPETRFSHFLE